jgi:hypothetical protein
MEQIYKQINKYQGTNTTSGVYPQPQKEQANLDHFDIYRPKNSLTETHQKSFGFYSTLAQNNPKSESDRLDDRYVEFYDTLNNLKAIILFSAAAEHVSFFKDMIKYQYALRTGRLDPKIKAVRRQLVTRTMYMAHVGRFGRFTPALFLLVEGPYMLTGDQRWTTQQYISTAATLGFYHAYLTKRTLGYFATCTVFPAILAGIWGNMENLLGRPIFQWPYFAGRRRTSDETAKQVLSKSYFVQFFKEGRD